MAQTTDNKATISFKKLQGKAHTDDAKAIGNEAVENRVNVHGSNVWSNTIDSTPATAVSAGVAEFINDAVFVEDVTTNGHSFYLTYPVGHDREGERITTAIPPSYGSGYEIAVKLVGGATLAVGDARNWVYDYENGYYWQQDSSATPDPDIADLYVYVGETVSDTLTNVQVPGRFTFTIQSGGSWDNATVPVYQVGETYPIQITKVKATVIGSATPQLTFNLEERNDGSLNSAGTDIMASDLTATATGAETTNFANPSQEVLEVNDFLVFTTGASAQSGTVDSITVTVFYNTIIS